ncbi:MAG: transporter substrate-binding domain-containing protein [Vicinamibacterales bacterium]
MTGTITLLAQSDDARRQLAPGGTLRAGLNTNNRLTTAVGRELATELARRLGVEASFVEYPSPGAVIDGVGKEWDLAFVAADPAREAATAFTDPYVEIEATYLVRGDSPIRDVDDIDRDGVRVATGATSAYTLVMKRELRHASLVFAGGEDALARLRSGEVDAVAALRDVLVRSVAMVPGSRVLPGNITRAQQAVAVPKANGAALAYVASFLADVKASGFLEQSIRKTAFIGASIPR